MSNDFVVIVICTTWQFKFFNGFEVFQRLSTVEEVPGDGARSTQAIAGDGVSRCWFRFLLLFLGYFFVVFSSFFFFHSFPLLCLNVTELFVGLYARSVIFYLLIVLECKE